MSDYDKIWGKYESRDSHGLSRRLMDWAYYNLDLNQAKANNFWPNIQKDDEKKISLWLTPKDRERGRDGRVVMSVGKAFRKMDPNLTDIELERIVDKFKDYFFPGDPIVKSGKDRASFKFAYTHTQAQFRNLSDYTFYRKSLANSCMRYGFDNIPSHPCEAYASGQFEIYWTELNGLIASRAIVYHCDNGHGYYLPVYGVSDHAIDVLMTVFNEKNYLEASNNDLIGAKLLVIPYQDQFIGPYLDISPQTVRNNGDGFLIVDRNGDIDASTYSGLYGGLICPECGENCNEIHSIGFGSYCDDCRENMFSFCERNHEWVESDYGSLVISNGYTEWWSDSAIENYAVTCEESGQYYNIQDCVQLANGNWISEDAFITEGYFICEGNSKIYNDDDLIIIGDKHYSQQYIDDNSLYYVFDNESCEWKERESA